MSESVDLDFRNLGVMRKVKGKDGYINIKIVGEGFAKIVECSITSTKPESKDVGCLTR